MPWVDVRGGRISYSVAGRGEAVLLIAGLGGLGSFWQAQIDALAPHFTTITFDHRGVGDSTGRPPYSIEQWAEDSIAPLDHIGIEKAHFVGHSAGGVIAQVVTSVHPHRVTSVVLGATWMVPDERFRRVFGLRRDVLSALGTDAYALLGSILIAPSNETLDAIKPDLTNSGIIKARIDALLNYHGIEYLRRIRCRALVLAAADDVLIPLHMSRAVAAGIAGAELKILPEGSHSFPRSRADDYNRIVCEFLSNHAASQSDTSITAGGEGDRL